MLSRCHDDIIKWKLFRVTGPLCGEFTGHQWIPLTRASDAELWCFLCAWIHGWVNNHRAGDLRRHCADYDVTVMYLMPVNTDPAHIRSSHWSSLYTCRWLGTLTVPDHLPAKYWLYIIMYVIMGAIASQITSLTVVYSTVYSDADQMKHQSSASLAFVRGTGEFPAQMASNGENVSIWWRHHDTIGH